MRIIMNVHASDPERDCHIGYAEIDFTPKVAADLVIKMQRVRITAAHDLDVAMIAFYRPLPLFIDYHEELDEWLAKHQEKQIHPEIWDATGYREIPDEYQSRTQCDRLHIYKLSGIEKTTAYTILWNAAPKFSDLTISTAYIPIELIRDVILSSGQEFKL